MDIYYVYQLRLADSNAPFYIGKGKGKRMHQHCHAAVLRCRSIKNSIIKSAKDRGVAVIPEIITQGLSERDAMTLEVQLIAKHGRLDKGTGILGNHTDGGDGTSGSIRSAESRAKTSVASMGKRHTPESRAKLSAAHLGRRRSEGTRAKMSASGLGRVTSPETRALISAAHTGKSKHTRESRALIAAAQIGRNPTNTRRCEQDILDMYEMFEGGATGLDVATKYSMSASAVGYIKSGRSFPELHRAHHSGQI